MTTKIRVLLAEDQAMVRGALTALLNLEDDLEVVAEVSRGDQVLSTAIKTKPDVALLDIEMPGSDGLSAAQALHKSLPACQIVILTTFGRSGYLRRAMESGAVGFLLKDAPADQLATAIRRVMSGERVVDPELALSALSEGDNPLTGRERDVLRASFRGDRPQSHLYGDSKAQCAQSNRGSALCKRKRMALAVAVIIYHTINA